MRSASGSAARTAQVAVITGSVVDDQPQRCPTGVRVDHDTALGDAHDRHDRFGEGIHQRLAAGRRRDFENVARAEVAQRDDAKAWALLQRHSPGVALPNRTFVISREAADDLRAQKRILAGSQPLWL